MTSETGFEQSGTVGTVLRMRTWSVAGSERKQSTKDRRTEQGYSQNSFIFLSKYLMLGLDSTSLKLYLSKVSLGSVSHYPLEFV